MVTCLDYINRGAQVFKLEHKQAIIITLKLYYSSKCVETTYSTNPLEA